MAFLDRFRFGKLLAIPLISWYFFGLTQFNEFHSEGVIENAEPEEVWRFLADFKNMKTLNPTILEATIGQEESHGVDGTTRYSVDYQERLSHWPHILNRNRGEVQSERDSSVFKITSKHVTSFLGDLYSLTSFGTFEIFEEIGRGTVVKEHVRYQCPPLPFARWFCEREVRYQRQHILENLKKVFQEN